LELSFDKKLLREFCENSSKANKKFGTDAANELRLRIADLRAATSVQDLVVGNPRATAEGQIELDAGTHLRIIFCANHNTVPKLDSGAVDWSRVSRVKILGIEPKNA
jgi:plasmid maintenance system killer protein